MAGTVFTLLERTDYNYSVLGANAATVEIPIFQNVDISYWREGTLLIRVHELSLGNAAAKFIFRLRSVLPSGEDPGKFFRDTTTVAELTIGQSTAPYLVKAALSANAGAMVSLFMVAQQGPTAGQGVAGTFSVALSLKD